MRQDDVALNALQVCIAASTEPRADVAVSDIRRQIRRDDTGLAVVFMSSSYDRAALGDLLRRDFDSLPLIGCTTAGEIGPLGYTTGGLSGFSFSEKDVVFEIGLLEGISQVNQRNTQAFAYGLRQRLAKRVPHFNPKRCFALLLIDGLSVREELVVRAVYDGLGGIPLAGGSAGDGLDFRQTWVMRDGRFYTDAAILLVASTPHPFETFKTQHFRCSEERLVVTAAHPDQRVATEINGFPAAEEYARAVGLDPRSLNPMVFSAHPMVVKIGGSDFVRSIQKVNPDGSMTFFCAIDEGIVFNIAMGDDLVTNLRDLFRDITRKIGKPALVIGCDCILRRLELEQKAIIEQVAAIMREHNVVGFSTYGEQYRGIHINQTFTGIAFGSTGTAT
jgi:hypothetical protein